MPIYTAWRSVYDEPDALVPGDMYCAYLQILPRGELPELQTVYGRAETAAAVLEFMTDFDDTEHDVDELADLVLAALTSQSWEIAALLSG